MSNYKYLGAIISDNDSDDEVVVFKNSNKIIAECVSKIVLFNDLKMDDYFTMIQFNKCNIELKQIDLSKSLVLDLYTKETFEKLFELDLISHQFDFGKDDRTKNWLLSHLVQYERDLPCDLLDYVFESNKEGYHIEGWLTLVKNLEIAKYLRNKGASLDVVTGYGSPKEVWSWNENKQFLIDYFYNNPVSN